ncbi:MAG: hypothetical protein IOD03_05340 [Methylocystis sp.]|nr:hypothetical protein [Methylocystis sp.]MCA3583092.1 hypothetical protein [Methylocystis sp.]
MKLKIMTEYAIRIAYHQARLRIGAPDRPQPGHGQRPPARLASDLRQHHAGDEIGGTRDAGNLPQLPSAILRRPSFAALSMDQEATIHATGPDDCVTASVSLAAKR